MKLPRTRLALRPGYLDCYGLELEQRSGAALVALAEADPDRHIAHELDLGGVRAWIKGGPLRRHARVRHTLRSLAGFPLPRLREFRNFEWLLERLFRAPEPLVFGLVRRFGAPAYQFLVTRYLPDSDSIDRVLPSSQPELRGALVTERAREVARMHALHFVHHDLYARNVLVAPPAADSADDRRLVFIDAWRGGPGYLLRGADYDLACLMVEGAELFTPFEQTLFFAEYLDERAAQGAAVDRRKLTDGIVRRRAALMARIAREPGRWRGNGPPIVDWVPPRS